MYRTSSESSRFSTVVAPSASAARRRHRLLRLLLPGSVTTPLRLSMGATSREFSGTAEAASGAAAAGGAGAALAAGAAAPSKEPPPDASRKPLRRWGAGAATHAPAAVDRRAASATSATASAEKRVGGEGPDLASDSGLRRLRRLLLRAASAEDDGDGAGRPLFIFGRRELLASPFLFSFADPFLERS
jgi:hypothetical protein